MAIDHGQLSIKLSDYDDNIVTSTRKAEVTDNLDNRVPYRSILALLDITHFIRHVRA